MENEDGAPPSPAERLEGDSTGSNGEPEKSAADKRKANLKPFPKGKSGNPSGTSKQFKEFQALARTYSVPILKRFAILGMRANSAFAVRAGEAVLERAWGKPAQPVVGAGGGPIEMAFRGAARAALENALAEEDEDAGGQASPPDGGGADDA